MKDKDALRVARYQNIAKSYSGSPQTSAFRPWSSRFSDGAFGNLEQITFDYWQASKYSTSDLDTTASISDYYSQVDVTLQQLALSNDATGETMLPKPQELRQQLSETLRRRKSGRRFTSEPISIKLASTLLGNACGITHTSPDGNARLKFRAYPSGGALYPVEVMLLIRSVSDLASGIYRYRAPQHSLEKVRAVDDAAVSDALIIQDDATLDFSVMIVLTIQPWRAMRKYGARGLRFCLHEVGSIAQNFHMCATGIGLGATDWASYDENAMNAALGLDGVYRSVAHTILVGTSAE